MCQLALFMSVFYINYTTLCSSDQNKSQLNTKYVCVCKREEKKLTQTITRKEKDGEFASRFLIKMAREKMIMKAKANVVEKHCYF